MTTPDPLVPTYVSYGQQVNAEYIGLVLHVGQHLRESIQAVALDPEETTRLRAVYVPTPAGDSATESLRARNAVALIGPSGCGREITGVAAITEVRATPHPLYLDPEDARRELPADRGCGYLVDIDEQAVGEIPALKDLIARYSGQLAEAGAYLVVTATAEAWAMLGAPAGMPAVTVQPPGPVDVFRSHLAYGHRDEADHWAQHSDVVKVLSGASPGDAARLARLADAALSSASGEDAVQQAISAYKNWATELAEWFRTHTEGYHRALLIAAAALNEADATTIFEATEELSQAVKLPRPPGGGLVGDGSARLLDEISAVLTDDGRIRLPRPAYSEAVLDHVWRDRPHLRADLKRWLVSLPGGLRSPAATGAGRSLIDLAVRHADPALIAFAVGTWAEQPACRELAATALTEAGLSGSTGRSIRRTMYGWASRVGTTRSLQLTVADVCGGPFGTVFPRNALTRLRHLAVNGSPEVQGRVALALQVLAREAGLRDFVLREIVDWTASADQKRVPGLSAFLALGTGSAADLLPRTLSDSARIDLLAEGLRAALRDPGQVARAREVCCGWLEAAAQGELAVHVVTDVIARTCQDSYDIGQLAPVVWRWGQAGGQSAVLPRDEIVAELLTKAADRDPLAPGVSAATVYEAASEEGE